MPRDQKTFTVTIPDGTTLTLRPTRRGAQVVRELDWMLSIARKGHLDASGIVLGGRYYADFVAHISLKSGHLVIPPTYRRLPIYAVGPDVMGIVHAGVEILQNVVGVKSVTVAKQKF